MAWKGSNDRMEREDVSDGMDGSTAISQIKNGYCLEALNVDLGLTGKMEKRSGYHMFGERLPVRTKALETAGATIRTVLDTLPQETVSVSLYANTAINATATEDALLYRVDDSTNTIFATFSSTTEITTDTILSAIGSDGLEHFTQPITVFYGVDQVKVLLPMYVKNWWTGSVLGDVTPIVVDMRICIGYALSKSYKSSGLSITTESPFFARIEFDEEPNPEIHVGATVLFETCLLDVDGNGITGTVTASTAEYCDVALDGVGQPEGTLSTAYFSLRVLNAKHLDYRGPQDLHMQAPFKILDACSFSCIHPTAVPRNELGFLYGTGISAGPVNIMAKYYDGSTGVDRIISGVDGYLFAEKTPASTEIATKASLRYMGATQNIAANITTDTFTVPLPGASDVYESGDTITISYASGTDSDVATGDGIITQIYEVSSATPTSLVLKAAGEKFFVVRQYTKFKFFRSSKVVTIEQPSFPICSGMSCQYQLGSKLIPNFEITDCDYTGSNKYLKIDMPITWSSDEVFVIRSVFNPVLSDSSCSFTTEPQTWSEVNSVAMERSTIIAAGLSGMWRFNGVQLLNLRIPRPASGLIRNVPGTGGGLRLDTQEDGTKTGRRYNFIVTYSYSELINGKLYTYESGRSPVSNYSIDSEQDDLGSSFSKFVELQVPCIPRGKGFPADDIFINVYRTKSGTLLTEEDAEQTLLERQVKNNPDAQFITIIAGTESQFIFNPDLYKIYYASVTGGNDLPEDRREIVDPPLSSVVSTLENRIVAASGYDHPQIHFICKDVYSTVDNSFDADYEITYSPRQVADVSYRFLSAPCTTTTTSGVGGMTSVPFQVLSLNSYEVNKITYTDNSHLFVASGASISSGTQYLIRLANGKKESMKPGTSDPYYNGYDFVGQVFTGTSVSSQLAGQKKWMRQDTSFNVLPPTEQILVFGKIGELLDISLSNGLVILGNSSVGVSGKPEFMLYTTLSLIVGDFVILKGLGTTGQVKNSKGEQLSFDRDLVFRVESGASPYTLTPYIMGNSSYTHFGNADVTNAISVSNAASGVTCEPFSVFKLLSTSGYSTTGWSKTPLTAEVELTTSPTISPVAGDYLCLDGLPSEIPMGSGFVYNGAREIVSFSGDKFVIKVSPPANAQGDLSQDFSAVTPKGKAIWTKGTVENPAGKAILRLTSATLSVAVAAGDYAYVIFKGVDPDSACLALTGWFPITQVTADGTTWVSSLAATSTIKGIEFAYGGTIDYSALTAASETKILIASRASDTLINVPVPCLATKDGSQDITGILYSSIDGYTPLERVIKQLTQAMNSVLREEGFAYWGGRSVGNVESDHPGNVFPVNGVKFMPHSHPENKFKYRYYMGNITRTPIEPQWKCVLKPDRWSIEGDQNLSPTTSAEVAVTTSILFRPSRMWYTNATGTLLGQSFRELSFGDIGSQDGERIVGLAPFKVYSILAKENSLWRLSFGGTDKLQPPVKVPGIVGATSHKNMVVSEGGVFLVHDTGVYITDGSTCESIHQTRRTFYDKCVQNRILFPLACGYHNTLTKTVYLGIPFSENSDVLTDKVDGQFVFDYSLKSVTLDTITKGWSINDGLQATNWLGIYNDFYFSGLKGAVYRLRTERGPTLWRDENSPISMRLKTRYILADDALSGRFLRSLYFQFGKETGVNMKVSMAWDFFKSYQPMQDYTIPADGFGTMPFGTGYWGGDKFIEQQRRTPDKMRVYQFSLQFEDSTLDSSGAIYGIFVQSEQMSNKLIGQGGDRA